MADEPLLSHPAEDSLWDRAERGPGLGRHAPPAPTVQQLIREHPADLLTHLQRTGKQGRRAMRQCMRGATVGQEASSCRRPLAAPRAVPQPAWHTRD